MSSQNPNENSRPKIKRINNQVAGLSSDVGILSFTGPKELVELFNEAITHTAPDDQYISKKTANSLVIGTIGASMQMNEEGMNKILSDIMEKIIMAYSQDKAVGLESFKNFIKISMMSNILDFQGALDGALSVMPTAVNIEINESS